MKFLNKKPLVISNKKLGIDYMHKLAKDNGGFCLSKKYVNSHDKLKWKCAEGHVWETSGHIINRGHWCVRCSMREFRIRTRKTISDMNDLVKDLGGKCLSKKYIKCDEPLKWQCLNGHVWIDTQEHVKGGRWCGICLNQARALKRQTENYAKLLEIAKNHGGKCLSKKYTVNYEKMQWECSSGHKWWALSTTIKRGSWCNICTRKKFRLTIEKMQDLAKSRGGRCLSKEYVSNLHPLIWECKNKHVWEAAPSGVKNHGSWCSECFYKSNSLTIEEMQEIAKSRSGVCLSKRYINSNINLLWQCEKGHQWKAAPKHIKRGYWCSVCARLLQKKGKPEVENNTIAKTLKSKLVSVPREARSLKRTLKEKNIHFL